MGIMKKNMVVGLGLLVIGSLSMGAFFNKSEATLGVIKAGADEKGNPICVNKAQVYLFKKNQAENKIVFHYHDSQSSDASIVKSFPDEESLDKYWVELLNNW
jgi:hypothetical protein